MGKVFIVDTESTVRDTFFQHFKGVELEKRYEVGVLGQGTCGCRFLIQSGSCHWDEPPSAWLRLSSFETLHWNVAEGCEDRVLPLIKKGYLEESLPPNFGLVLDRDQYVEIWTKGGHLPSNSDLSRYDQRRKELLEALGVEDS